MKIKKILGLASLLALSLTGCNKEEVPAGYEGKLIDKKIL